MRLLVHNARVCTFLFLAIPVVGSRPVRYPEQNQRQFPSSSDLQSILTEANRRFQFGEYDAALELYSKGLELSRGREDALDAAFFLLGVGNYHVIAHQYREALEAYREASKAAIDSKHAELAMKVAVNRATLYRRMREKDAAIAAMREIRHLLPAQPPPRLLIQAGNLLSDQSGIDAATPYFSAAADAAAQEGDVATQAAALSQLGYLQLEAGHLEAADRAFANAFRLRKLSGNGQPGTLYGYLAMLRLAQGDPSSALNLIDRALEARSKAMPVAPAFLHNARAHALAALDRLPEAIEEYEVAIRSALDWRLRVLPSDAFRISADVSLQEIYSGYIDAAMALYHRTGDRWFQLRAFEIAETSRAASLRESARERALPAAYWEAVENLRKAIAAEVTGDPSAKQRAQILRAELARHESELDRADGENSHRKKERSFSENSLSHLQKQLNTDEVLLSFHTGAKASYLWTMTGESFESYLLPGRREIAPAADSFRTAVSSDSSKTNSSGTALFRHLFGQLSSTVTRKSSWLLSVDDPLYGVPFSALPDPETGEYLVMRRTLRTIPGAAMTHIGARPAPSARFVGFADPVYNLADPRSKLATADVSAQLPRLPGTWREVSSNAKSWSSQTAPVVLRGLDVNRAAVQLATTEPAGIVHFGTHVVPDPQSRGSVAIALGLNAGGSAEYLTASDITGWRCPAGVVVLSGCASGTGRALPGAGLVGLTRAWLVAGAQAVAATYWPIPDDAHAFFSAFYKHLQKNATAEISASAAAASLRAAQIETIRSGGSYAKPEYWAAFFVVGKD